jgi:hypothetical protein
MRFNVMPKVLVGAVNIPEPVIEAAWNEKSNVRQSLQAVKYANRGDNT